MTPQQMTAFAEAAGFQPSQLTFLIRLIVGGFTLLCALIILLGLMRMAEGSRAYDKTMFMTNLLALMFFIMLIFAYVA